MSICHPGGMSLDPRSASMNLWHWLLGHGASEDEATELMNGYAHELAEQIRNAPLPDDGHYNQADAASVIDPHEQALPVDEYRLSTRLGVVGGEQ